jgi:hypothetical protein
MTPPVGSPYDELFGEVDKERGHWDRYGRFYGVLYPLIRVLLIIASAIVAAGTTLAGSPLGFLVPWLAVLALFVAIVTALDTWVKPNIRWQASMKALNALTDLRGDMLRMPDRTLQSALDVFDDRLQAIRAQALADYVF